MKHRIDLQGDRLVSLLLDMIQAEYLTAREYGREIAEGRVPTAFKSETEVTVSAVSTAAWQSVLKEAIAERTALEESSACHIISDGEAFMADGAPWMPLPFPFRSDECGRQLADHIVYGSGSEDSLLLCPTGRGYWQLARVLLGNDRERLRQIARDSRGLKHGTQG